MPDERPIVKLLFGAIEVDVDDEGRFELFGCPRFICPDHKETEYDIKTCFLDILEASLSYAYEDDDKLTEGAQALKQAVLENIKIMRR